MKNINNITRSSSASPPAFLGSDFQRRHKSSGRDLANPDNSENRERNQCKEDMRQAKSLIELIDEFEELILRDLDSSHPKQNSANADIIDSFLHKPRWSMRDEYGQKKDEQQALKYNESLETPQHDSISDEEIQRLLRLSALPSPKDPRQFESIRRDLKSQLAFVRKIQSVNTEGVEPLVCVRDETTQGVHDSTITLDDLQTALSKEYQIGKCQRPRRRKNLIVSESVKWDVFANSENVVEMNGEKYFIVKQLDSTSNSEVKENTKT